MAAADAGANAAEVTRDDRGPGRAEEPPTLPLARRLLDALDAAGIRYCHWKSNWTIAEALAGKGDVDLLVDRAQTLALRAALAGLGFRCFQSPAWSHYPAVEDFLGYDAEGCRVLHCHVHYRLVTGAKLLKECRLPWEEVLLAGRTRDEEHGVWLPAGDHEMLLFLVRMGLRSNSAGDALRLVGRGERPDAVQGEFRWLQGRSSPGAVADLGARLLGERAREPLLRALSSEPTPSAMRVLARAIGPNLRAYMRRAPAAVSVARWTHLIRAGLVIVTRKLGFPVPRTRQSRSGGAIVAVIGADGSGKSTVAREVARCFSGKLEVMLLYFGSGDGPASLPRRLLMPLRGLVARRERARQAEASEGDGAGSAGAVGRRDRGARLVARFVWALLLAREKRSKLTRAWRAATNGALVVTDRYPQCEVMGSTDGPLLSECRDHPSPLLRRLARWESGVYEWARAHPPDRVLRLRVSPEIAAERKPDHRLEWARRRIEIADSLSFGEARVTELDADRPLEEVLREAKRVTWECM